MKRDHCGGWLALAGLVITAGCNDSPSPPAPRADKGVILAALDRDYLLGESVVLKLQLINQNEERIRVVEVFIEPEHYEAPLWIARDGQPFQEFNPGRTRYKKDRHVSPLKPNEALLYGYRAVGVPGPKFRLAFPAPGAYRVYAVYPLYLAGGPPQSIPLTSNVINESKKVSGTFFA